MIRLILTKQVLGVNTKPERLLSACYDHVDCDQNYNSNSGSNNKTHKLNIILPESKLNKILNPKDPEPKIEVNIMTYPDNFIVPKASVEAIPRLSKTQFEVLKHLFSGKTLETIADERFISLNTIKRHSCDIRQLLDLDNRCHLIIAYVRHLLEYEEDVTGEARNHKLETINSKPETSFR
jgi:DNA-binding CsgD family transcriptional regulator